MLALELIAERKIAEAVERGDFDDLPGRGRPLDLTEDPLVPEEMRMALRVLKNAGYSLAESEGGKEERRVEKKLALLKTRIESRYFSRVVRKLGGY